MHRQRTFLSLATLLSSLAFLFNWVESSSGHWSGLYAGYAGLFSVLCYVGMLIVIIIDITDRPLSKQRLVVMGFVTLACFSVMMYLVYRVVRRISVQELGFGIVAPGLAIFLLSNMFMLAYCAYSYKNDYIIPEADDTLLDEQLKP